MLNQARGSKSVFIHNSKLVAGKHQQVVQICFTVPQHFETKTNFDESWNMRNDGKIITL